MMRFDRIKLGRKAKELGFVRDTFEKVCRLVDVLQFMSEDELLSKTLALKGGTAINLTIFDLPRLSVDIDLDYSRMVSRDTMLEERKVITERITKYMVASGYVLSGKSKNYHALDSFVYEYQNAGGMKDNIKIEINYMLRCHVFEEEYRKVNISWNDSKLKVLCVNPIEVFASKIIALLNRTAPRDLYDISNMIKYEIFDDSQREMLRKCGVFYNAISLDTVSDDFRFEAIKDISLRQIKTSLYPVLRNNDRFNLEETQELVIKSLSSFMLPDVKEKEFWINFKNGKFLPELIFGNCDESSKIKRHPMAEWKTRRIVEENIINDEGEHI